MEKLKLYIKESYFELMNKVTWPTWPALLATSRVVIVGSIIFTLIIFVLSFISNQLTDIIYGV